MVFSQKNYFCKYCNFTTTNLKDYKRHEQTKKHTKNSVIYKEEHPYDNHRYKCSVCEYGTDNSSNYNRHIKSVKHLLKTNDVSDTNKYVCICGASYKYSSSRSLHRKNCIEYTTVMESYTNNKCEFDNKESNKNKEVDDSEISDSIDFDTSNNKEGMVSQEKYLNLATKLVESESRFYDAEEKIASAVKKIAETQEQNNKLIDVVAQQQEKLNDIIPMIGNTTNNTTNNNVSINVFLNEKCKDAINLMDFVNSIQLQISDLERTAELGFVDSISNLLIDGLSQMKVTDRPIHCTDGKRDVLYVKDNDSWAKDGTSHDKMKRAINKINMSNSKQLTKWVNDNPECNNSNTEKNTKYMNIISNTVACEDEEKKVKKIIKNVAKAVVLDKECMNDNID